MTKAANHRMEVRRRTLLVGGLALALLVPSMVRAQYPMQTGGPRPNMASLRPQAKDAGASTDPAVEYSSAPGENVVDVRIVGNQRLSSEKILSKIKTYPGRPYRDSVVREDVQRLMGTYWFYDVSPFELNTPEGLVVEFHVVERRTIDEVKFIGNTVFKEADLKKTTGLEAGKAMDVSLNKVSAQKVEKKYHDKGYPFATVELAEGGDRNDTRVVMNITEGPKTKISSVQFEGNTFVSEARLRTQVDSKRHICWIGGKYKPDLVTEDVAKLIQYYRTNGYLDVRVSRKEQWSEDRSRVVLVYIIEEGERYKVRNVAIAGNEKFEDARLTEPLATVQGAFFNQKVLDVDKQKVTDAYGSKGHIHTVVNTDVRYLDLPGEVDVVFRVEEDIPRQVGEVRIEGNEVTKSRVIRSRMRIAPGEIADTTKLRESQQRLIESRLFEVNPQQGIVPVVEFDPNNDPNAEVQDIRVTVQEAQTGSLLFGVGINSESGVGGSLVLHERNFDIARFPTSFGDLFSGQAFRGAGQELRIEAVPGTLVHRYSVTFREPQLFGLDYNFATSGYFFRRLYSNYTEERAGGRFTLGKRFTDEVGGSVTLRLENVEIGDVVIPVPDLLNVVGDSFLSSVRFAVNHDTRDSHLNPGAGHFVEMGYEQAFGDFDFPKATVEGRQFWTVYQRADGSGKHVVTARGEVGYSGNDTPVFERFFAGGFSTIRGFDFRGVSPTQLGTEVGGNFMLLSGLEYQFPLTADDNLGWVFFVDAGTVETDVEINDYRVAAGFGLRVKIPMMGPVPLAFDFGFPIVKNDDDDEQLFSFFLGFFR